MKYLLFFCPALLLGSCLPVESDQVVARDLAKLVPAFAALPPDQPIIYAPMPGVRRMLGSGEIVRIARRSGLDVNTAPDLCFEYATRSVSSREILEAIRASLDPDVEIELVETVRYQVPNGTLVFPKTGLNVFPRLTPESIVLWRGHIVYAGKRQFPIWARLRLSAERSQIVARTKIPAGEPIRKDQIEVCSRRLFPLLDVSLASPESVVGRIARAGVAPGEPLLASALLPPKQVVRGSMVQVVVRTEGAQLKFPGRALTNGSMGEEVTMTNPSSGRQFKAVVEGDGLVGVDATAEKKPAGEGKQ